jgi:hypothetical protein
MENYLKNSQSYIYRALLKNGHSKFSLTILEYCDKEKCLSRENYYLKAFNPEYNISKEAGAPMSGHSHSEETRKKMSDTFKKINHSGRFKKGQVRPEVSGRPSQQIEVTDNKNNQTTTYDSISAAARALNIHPARIVMYFSQNQKKPYKGQYTFKKI